MRPRFPSSPRPATSVTFLRPIHVPQTNDPAEIAKLAEFGLTPGQAFPGNKIPTGLISTNATAVLNAGLFPAANAANNLYYAVNNNVTILPRGNRPHRSPGRQQTGPDGVPDLR